jgi:glycine/D-amino acid oxidase-like deaminating enzyme
MLDRIDENRSVWVADKPPYEPLPPLRSEEKVDVVIVGGGFVGVSTAWHLARAQPDLRILLIEARELANGASGRNGGLMLNWVAGVHTPELEDAKRIYDVTQLGMEVIEEMIAEHDLDVPRHRRGSLEIFTHAELAEEAAERVAAYEEAGIPVQWLDRRALGEHVALEGARGAMFDPRSGHLDGVALLRGMRPVLVELGVAVHENTPALRIEEGKRIRVFTPEAEIDAGAVVLATGAYTPHLGYFRDRMFPLQSHVVATAPQSEDAWRRAGYPGSIGFSDDLDRIAYGCMTSRGELVFGGGSNAAYTYMFGGKTRHARPPERGYRAVEERLHSYLPRVADVPIRQRWSGTLGITMSRVCAMGARGEHRNVLYAFGFSGHGIVMANLAGRVLRDVYLGDDARWRDLPFFEPRLWPIPSEPFRWLGYHAFTIFTGRSPRRAH